MNYKNVFNQEKFLGQGRKPPYFEGWYFRFVTANGRALSFIPGISLNESSSQSFVQMIESSESRYFKFPAKEFEYSEKSFYVKVGNCTFTSDGISINLNENSKIIGKVKFKNKIMFPKSTASPGIMGLLSYLPTLKCNHAIICVKCDLEGEISIDDNKIDFDGGVGYIEKDWGSSFPDSYIWAQSCGFDDKNTSFMIAVAKIYVLGLKLNGLISFLYHNCTFYKFATYSGAYVKNLYYNDSLSMKIKSPEYTMRIDLSPDEAGVLKAPENGAMNREIRESGCGQIDVTLLKGRNIIYSGKGKSAGIEFCGNILSLK